MINVPDKFDSKANQILSDSQSVSERLDLPIVVSKVQLVSAASVKPQPIKWLWADWLAAGKFHILGGAAGTGKTTIALSIAATLSAGGLWTDGSQASKGRVVIWSSEDSPEDTLVPRLIQCGADLEFVSIVGDVLEPDGKRAFDPGSDIPQLRQAISLLGNVDLLIVDPIVSAVTGNDHKNSEVRRGLQPLVDLAQELNCAVLGVTHFSKNTNGRSPLERITGSLAFGALARVVWVTAKSDDSSDKRLLLKAKSNICSDEGGYEYEIFHKNLVGHPGVAASSVRWGEPVEGSARVLLGQVESCDSEDRSSALSEAEEFLVQFLSQGTVSSMVVMEKAKSFGISCATLRRASKKLGVKSVKLGMNQGWGWSLESKMLNRPEDTHVNGMSTFEKSQHLRERELSPTQRQLISEWLVREGDGDLLESIISKCETDPDARQYYLSVIGS